MSLKLFGGDGADEAALVRAAAQPLDSDGDYERVLDFVGDASVVLLGEATHGTQEFYAMRGRITRALIERRGFSAVAIEGDWPDAWQVNRFVQGRGGLQEAGDALASFARFPTWMWRNTVVEAFVQWLQRHNAACERSEQRVGFYGLDLYSLHASMRAVVDYLDRHDASAARAARASYACFDQFGPEPETYAWAAGRLGDETCAAAVGRELVALQQRRAELLARDGVAESDDFFQAEQNARLARNAEKYYRTMLEGHVASWNVRDRHMAETLERLCDHLRQRGQEPKVVVWAHNSHLGDARATEMGEGGELNLGQLVREWIGARAKLIGFTTHTGRVIAASDWGGPAECKRVRPSLGGSWEELFHRVDLPRFFLPLYPGSEVCAVATKPRLERAIGVIYRPETERQSHYFQARIGEQFDAVIHIDETQGVEPLAGVGSWRMDEVPETFPSGV